MNPLFGRLLKGKEKIPAMPVVPNTIHSLEDHQRVSVVGWIANKLGQFVGVQQCEHGKLITDVLNIDLTKLNLEIEEEYLYYLADRLVAWLENDEDVYLNIKDMQLSSTYHKNLLEVYELLKENNHIYFNLKNEPIREISEDDKEWEIYRDVLHAASHGKFLLSKEEDIEKFKNERILLDEPVVVKEDVPLVRNKAKEKLLEEGISSTKVTSYILLISEAITNILKHAKNGRLLITMSGQSLNILIEDEGEGFPLKILPYTVLMPGYSTKRSLGQGFTLMLKLSTRVLLKTSSSGSTIVLIFKGVEENGES
nr:ATP-binding protein [Lysinibacillus timonensis]